MKQNLWRVIIPTSRQALSCTGISFLIIAVLYHDQIWQRFQAKALTGALGESGFADRLSKLTNTPIIHTLVIVAFWSVVGLVAYTLVWSLINVLIEARNEVVLETAYTNKADFGNRIKTPLLQLAIAVALFGGLLLCARVVFPFWLDLVSNGLASNSIAVIWLQGLGALLGMAATLYFLLLLGQLIFWLG